MKKKAKPPQASNNPKKTVIFCWGVSKFMDSPYFNKKIAAATEMPVRKQIQKANRILSSVV